jgi:uncharacterized protein (DUF433 family)
VKSSSFLAELPRFDNSQNVEMSYWVRGGGGDTCDLPSGNGWSKMTSMKPELDLPDLLVCTPQGSWRIAGTRVSIDSVIHAFWEGATPEEICQDFPTLSLVQVYEAIAYYLKQRDKVDAYLQAGRDSAQKLQQELNGRHRELLSKLRQQLLSSRQSPTPS